MTLSEQKRLLAPVRWIETPWGWRGTAPVGYRFLAYEHIGCWLLHREHTIGATTISSHGSQDQAMWWAEYWLRRP